MKSTLNVIPVLLVTLAFCGSGQVPTRAGLWEKVLLNFSSGILGCKLSVNELPHNQPLYVNPETKKAIIPTSIGNKIVLSTETGTIGFACPEKGKQWKVSTYNCTQGKLYRFLHTEVMGYVVSDGYYREDPKYLTCNQPLPVHVYEAKTECLNEQKWHMTGFLVDKKFSPLLLNCYNYNNHSPSSSSHEIDGKVVTGENTPWTLDTDIKGGGEEEKKQNEFYIKKYQLEMVKKYRKSEALKVFGEKGEIYLVPLRLVPAKDLVLSSLGTAASAYTNIVPIFPTTGPIWVLAENYIRRVAKKLQETITVYTGVSGQITIGSEGLKIGSVPIPAYIWKIVSYKNQCFVLAMANNIRTNEVKCKKHSGDNFLHEKICCSSYDDFNELNPSILPTLKNKECETVLRV